MANVGSLTVKVGADVSGLQKGMDRATDSVEDFDKRAARMGRTFGKVAVGIAAAAVAIGVAVTRASAQAGDLAREIESLSAISGTGVEEFQKLSEAARTVGIEQEKLADIFKDVNDKFGDFMATGAGPLADFFENIAPVVGVTAEQFARLSGPEALQLYVDSLEEANVSQQQMTFYMEALASDATALLPLLRDNGREMQALGRKAEETGRVLSEDTVKGARETGDMLLDLKTTIRNEMITAIIGLEDELEILAEFFVDTVIPAIEATVRAAAKAAGALGQLKELIQFIRDPGAAVGGDVADKIGGSLGGVGGDGSGPMSPEDAARLFPGLTIDVPTPESPSGAVPIVKPTKTRGGGGGRGGVDREDFEALQERFQTEAEYIEEQRLDALERLREYREAKLATEEEFNALEKRINEKHQDEMARVEDQAREAKLRAMSDMFGGLSTLMATENEKLFKIGQAAAVAEAVVSGYASAVSAWEKGMKIGGPPVAAAFTAASLSRTGALISSIAGARSGASGGASSFGGSIAETGAAQAAPSQAPLEARITGLDPNSIFSGSSITSLFDALQDEAGDRGLSVSFVQ